MRDRSPREDNPVACSEEPALCYIRDTHAHVVAPPACASLPSHLLCYIASAAPVWRFSRWASRLAELSRPANRSSAAPRARSAHLLAEGGEPHTTQLSYFSRLTDADTFQRLAWVETHRRGVTGAADVCGVVDGADWCQGFLDWHCRDAVRILDFAHAAEYVAKAARAAWGPATPALASWLGRWLHQLEHGDPAAVLAALEALPSVAVMGPAGVEHPRETALQYLTKRRAQIDYATFLAARYPIGSGPVESANKVVMEARLKGSGMHSARPNVNPMLALRARPAAIAGRRRGPR